MKTLIPQSKSSPQLTQINYSYILKAPRAKSLKLTNLALDLLTFTAVIRPVPKQAPSEKPTVPTDDVVIYNSQPLARNTRDSHETTISSSSEISTYDKPLMNRSRRNLTATNLALISRRNKLPDL